MDDYYTSSEEDEDIVYCRPTYTAVTKEQEEQYVKPMVKKPKKCHSCMKHTLQFVSAKNDDVDLPEPTTTSGGQGPRVYYEYGEGIDGYKYITDDVEFKKYWEAHEVIVQNETLTYIDDVRVRIPMGTVCYLADIELEELDSDAIEEFYEKLSAELDVGIAKILRKERIFWHPDKFAGLDDKDMRKVTRIFQIVNGLWEARK